MRRNLFLSFTLLLVLCSAGHAQHWQKIHHFDRDLAITFINENVGFAFGPEDYRFSSGVVGNQIGQYGESDTLCIFRTSDGGKDWSTVNIGFTQRNSLGLVAHPNGFVDLSFASTSRGYYAIDGGDTTYFRGGWDTLAVTATIFETTDSGLTWHPFSKGKWSSLYAMEGALFAVGRPKDSADNGVWVTRDQGRSWQFLRGEVFTSLVFGNRDRNLYCPGSRHDQSTDLGLTWDSSTIGQGYHGGYFESVFPHSNVLAQMGHSTYVDWNRNDGYIQFSEDAGNTFQTRYLLDNFVPETMGADGCVLYFGGIGVGTLGPVDILHGLMRTTDYGLTWKNVGGPVNVRHPKQISVVGRGAVVYAFDSYHYNYTPSGGTFDTLLDLWKTTDGGDGTLSVDTDYLVTTSHTLSAASHADTLVTKLCDSTTLSLWLQYKASCSAGGLDSVRIDGLSGAATYSAVLTDHPLIEIRPDTAWITIHPEKAGTYPIVVHVQYSNDSYESFDTTFTAVVVIRSNPGTLSVSTQAIDFGAQTMCSALKRVDTIRVRASGCEAVQVDSIVFRESDAASSDFGFVSSQSFAIGSSDKARAFPITFKPTHPSKESGWIYVYSSNGVDSIEVTGEGVADSRAFIADRDTLRVQMCDSSAGVFRISNTTCGSLIIDSVTLADGFTLPLASNGKPQLPLALGRDQQEDITIRYQPSVGSVLGASSVNVTAHVRYLGKGDTVAFDTVLTLPLVVSRGVPSLALTEQSLDLGDVSTCAADTVSLGILSNGCDTLQITNASLASGTALALVRKPGSSVPTGSSDSVLISFAPSATGTVQDTLILTTNAGIRRVPITATGVAGTKTVAQSENEIEFGKLGVCQDSSRSITLTNKGCADVTITDANLTGQGFAYTGSLPITLKPGESTTLTVSTTSDTTGHPTNASGTLTFTTTADNTLAPVTLTRSYEYPARLAIRAVSDASGHAGDEVKFQVLLEGDVPKGMSALYFDLSNDDDLLSFVSASGVVEQGVTGGTPVSTRTFKLSPVRDTGVIGELTFHAYLAKASTTSLTLSNLHFDYPNLTVPPDCIASVEGSGSDFTYIYECGEGLIQKYMLGESLAIESVAPNPASKTIEVKLRGAERLSMIDVLGRERLQIAPSSKVMIDVSRLSAGTYYLRATGSGGVRTARVEVQR